MRIWSSLKQRIRVLLSTHLYAYGILPANDEDWIWCLVGNISDKVEHGEAHEIKNGTKHFSPGTKVYCYPPLWGDGYEKIKVIGRHRKSKRLITIVMRSNSIEKWRVKKVFAPIIISEMRNNRGWANTERDRADIEKIIEGLNHRRK
jgi:hypothetical protein